VLSDLSSKEGSHTIRVLFSFFIFFGGAFYGCH